MEKIRAFIAIELPEELKVSLTKLQNKLRTGKEEAVKWVDPKGLHLTLKFLGSIPSQMVSEISQAISPVVRELRPFTLQIHGLGAFPSLKAPRVVWVGTGGDLQALLILQKRVDQALSPLGFETEKAFSPHLTLGRVREKAPFRTRELLGQEINQLEVPKMPSLRVESLSLMRSTLTPSGAVYSRLASFALANQALDEYTKNRP